MMKRPSGIVGFSVRSESSRIFTYSSCYLLHLNKCNCHYKAESFRSILFCL
ncbi:Uncharacterized protein BM_BM14207 [Brugia malayi]|uniref:Bm14207 n=1 Tax=Brugia malayi TaxID=6279 RepID=A0A0K0J0J0_BRUMA|nr:Uncharacterized protein BM_BM14207 [Brugia malayi]CDP96148.1 Bm14207 [Brugia malayi]VIO98575.1 Uncharacterized protein BM_BM14207 [Brugia malayi]